MRWGYCSALGDMGAVAEAGFDFFEARVGELLRGDEPDEQWRGPGAGELALPVEACNVLLSKEHRVVGPDRDWAGLKRYMERVARRAGELGVRRLVFGSGAARSRGERMSENEAMGQIADFCAMAGDMCGEHGVMLLVEHLNPGETNMITSLEGMLRLVDRVRHPAVAAVVDTYHIGPEAEFAEAVVELGGRIRHVHVAERGRALPGRVAAGEQFDFECFFALLQKIGYDERISVEAKVSEPLEQVLGPTLAHLKQRWDAAACDDPPE